MYSSAVKSAVNETEYILQHSKKDININMEKIQYTVKKQREYLGSQQSADASSLVINTCNHKVTVNMDKWKGVWEGLLTPLIPKSCLGPRLACDLMRG